MRTSSTRTARTLAVGSDALALALAGCAAGPDDFNPSPSATSATTPSPAPEPVPVDDSVCTEDRVRLNDDRVVTCLRYKDKLLSCDWVGAGAAGDAQ